MDCGTDEDVILYGDPLPDIEEDEIPKKKCIRPEDQIVTDEKGRRRFHGAFTGGFSAGYYNSVGSVEGWIPSSFQSSRSNRMGVKEQQPEDFMDHEDLGQFGIAPRKIQATKNFRDKELKEKNNKRLHSSYSESPIPGIPPLKELVIPSNDTVGIKLLKKMGWRPGQGIGPRITHGQKRRGKNKKIYGCFLPDKTDEESDDEYAKKFTFAPEDSEEVQYVPKTDLQGLGYTGLNKNPVLGSHFSLFESAPITIDAKKKLNIRGQAFGVGIYEEEDEDIYNHEDLSQYDFSLDSTNVKKKNENKLKDSPSSLKHLEKVLEGFQISHTNQKRKHYPLPTLPRDFKPVHKIQLAVTSTQPTTDKKVMNRHSLNSSERSVMIGEKKIVSVFDLISSEDKKRLEAIKQSVASSSVKKAVIPSATPEEVIPKPEQAIVPKCSMSFKPFASDPSKQKRYEEFLYMMDIGTKDKFPLIQPPTMTEWEKVREQEEFQKASQLYRPLAAGIASRFVSASNTSEANVVANTYESKEEKSDLMKAAEQNKFGELTREKVKWHPDKLLCKRFNVPDPYPDSTLVNVEKPKKEKFSIFNFVSSLTEEIKPLDDNDSQRLQDLPITEVELPNQSEISSPEKNNEANVTKDSTDFIELLDRPPMDLFKAIFQSSDENSSSSSDEEDNKADDLTTLQTSQTSQSEIGTDVEKKNTVTFVSPFSRMENHKTESITVPQRQGIFDNIDLDELCKGQKTEIVKDDNNLPESSTDSLAHKHITVTSVPEDMLYGPKLPPKIVQESEKESNLTKIHHKKMKKHKKQKHKQKHKHRKKEKECKTDSESQDEDVQILRKLKKLTSRK